MAMKRKSESTTFLCIDEKIVMIFFPGLNHWFYHDKIPHTLVDVLQKISYFSANKKSGGKLSENIIKIELMFYFKFILIIPNIHVKN